MTIMEEKIKQALQEWNPAPTPTPTPTPTIKSETNKMAYGDIVKAVLGLIETHPGINGQEIRAQVQTSCPEVPASYIPSILSTAHKKGQVTRTPIKLNGGAGRGTFKYFIAKKDSSPAPESGTLKSTHKTKEGINTLLPKPPADVGISITIKTTNNTYILDAAEVKALYKKLHNMFGG